MNLTGRLRGFSPNALGERVISLLSPAIIRHEVLTGGEDLKAEMVKRVPRETGELEGEIVVRPMRTGPGVFVAGIGVPADSPAIVKAFATEYPETVPNWTHRGVPGNPTTNWPAKSKQGATMPWARQSVLVRKNGIMRKWRQQVAQRLRRR